MGYKNECSDTNHKKGIIGICNQTADIPYSDSEIRIYCERKNFKNPTGGEDTYPIANSNFILSADGLGSGSCCHKTLEEKYADRLVNEKRYADRLVNDVFGFDDSITKLREKLDNNSLSEDYKALIKKEIEFTEKVRHYALNECFASPAPNTFFYSEDEKSREPYSNDKLSERTTAYIGSRLVSIAVYYKFGNFAEKNNITDWWKPVDVPEDNEFHKYQNMPWGKVLTLEIQEYITQGLKEKLFGGDNPLFKTSGEGISSKHTDYYILPTTLGCVFFANNAESADTVNALVVWIGDARCYKVDAVDGVKCITKDDSIPHCKDMSAIITFGEKPINAGNYKDNVLNARILNVKKPCAFISCSDGVYDTCPTKKSLQKNNTEPQNSTEFEYKLLSVLRNSHSMNDVYYGLAYSFYFGQGDWKSNIDQYGTSEEQQGIKSDDSGSIALKAFWTKEYKFFSDMLKPDTTLDKLHDLIEKDKIGFEEYFGKRVIAGEVNEEKFAEFLEKLTDDDKTALKELFRKAFEEVLGEDCEYAGIYGVEPLTAPRSIPIARTYAVKKRTGSPEKASEQVVNSHFAKILLRAISDYHSLEKMLENVEEENKEEIERITKDFLSNARKNNEISPSSLICEEGILDKLKEILNNEGMKTIYDEIFYTADDEEHDKKSVKKNRERDLAEKFECAERINFPYYNGKPDNDYFDNNDSNNNNGENEDMVNENVNHDKNKGKKALSLRNVT